MHARQDVLCWKAVGSHPDFAIFESLPGAGEALIPRLIAALGTQRHRFRVPSRFSPIPEAFYELQLSRGKKRHTPIRALAYKWIRILFRCWKERLPYIESATLTPGKKESS
jgi:hypothetical protein